VLEEWLKQFKVSVLNTSANEIFGDKRRGKISDTARVEKEHPTDPTTSKRHLP
jgi:hypothetical protein